MKKEVVRFIIVLAIIIILFIVFALPVMVVSPDSIFFSPEFIEDGTILSNTYLGKAKASPSFIN